MLKVERKVFERAVIQLITTTDSRELMREFSLYRTFFSSLLKDVSNGKQSPNYPILRKIAQDRRVNEQFIIEQAKFILSQLAPDEPKEDYYRVLHVSPTAPAEEIRKSWLSLVKTNHPDNAGDRGLDITKKLNEAYEVLGNPVKRGEYDARRLPAMPIVVVTPRRSAILSQARELGSRRLAYSVSFAIAAFALIFYLTESGSLFHLFSGIDGSVEGTGEVSLEEAGGIKEGGKTEETKLPTAEVSPRLATEKDLPSEPKMGKNKVSLSSTEWDNEMVAQAVTEAGKVPRKGEKKPARPEETPGAALRGNTLQGNKIAKGDVLLIPGAGYEDVKGSEPQGGQSEYVVGQTVGENQIGQQQSGAAVNLKPLDAVDAVDDVKAESAESGSSVEGYGSLSYPDRTSLYSFISEYVSVYKKRDIAGFMSLFEPDARENGVEMSTAISSYINNFSSLEIMDYDVRITSIDLRTDNAVTTGNFALVFRRKNGDEVENTNGTISWFLSWRDDKWKIKEINYRIKNAK